MGDVFWTALDAVTRELLAFAAFGIVLLGVDDLLMDLAWIATGPRRWRTNARIQHARDNPDLRLAVLVPAWDESDVIEPMVRHALARWQDEPVRLLVGVYPNDPATIHAVAAVKACDDRVEIVVLPHEGPTTKGDCLNHLWRHLERSDTPVDAVVLHDAEDEVAVGELALYRSLLGDADFVQLPVRPILTGQSVADSYFDEFAEAHDKDLPTRQALGAAVPGAGVGCAIRCETLRQLDNGVGPFPDGSLVEDYELGLRIGATGGRSLFVPAAATGGKIVVRAHFPRTITTAVRQKSRWVAGIALNGWDRLGWSGTLAEGWMRLRDRRAPLSAFVLSAGYVGLLVLTVLMLSHWLAGGPRPLALADPWLVAASRITAALLLWRLSMRAIMSGRVGGWREGVRAVPRAIVSNIIAILAARRAIGLYWRWRRTGEVRWDKTAHEFSAETLQP